MTDIYSAGPRLTDTPSGDPERQAIASLRGYAYQLYASALAWFSLRQGEELYLEVAEDYAIATQGAVQGVQVKDTVQSGSITINSLDARAAIDAYVDLVERNPNLSVTFHFLSTADIGKERKRLDRVGNESVLEYWRRAAGGADVAPLRDALRNADLSARVRQFIDSRDDSALRRELLQKVHWDCGRPDLQTIKEELNAAAIEYGSERFQLRPTESEKLTASVLEKVLATILAPGNRRLVPADLLQLFNVLTQISISRSSLEAMLQQMSIAGGVQAVAIESPLMLEPESELPFPELLASRQAVTSGLAERLRHSPLVFASGGTGLGKTLASRIFARQQGGNWYVVDFRDSGAKETAQRIRRIIGKITGIALNGLLLDDLNEAEDPEVARELVRLIAAMQRRDMVCIVTAYREPSQTLLAKLGITAGSHFAIPEFDQAEVDQLVSLAGGAPRTWGKVIHLATGQGHPQLVQAMVVGLETRGWPSEDLKRLTALEFSTSDLDIERRVARQRLVAALDEGSRLLLYRTSLLLGRFERNLAIHIGGLRPPISIPGEKLDRLVGPWIDQIGKSDLRLSPLVSNAGNEVLSTEDKLQIHRAAAEWITKGTDLDPRKANAAFVHGLLGKSDQALMKIAYAILHCPAEKMGLVTDWLATLVSFSTDRPIYANPTVARTIRLCQLLLVAETDNISAACNTWQALQVEIGAEQDEIFRDKFEFMALSKVLINQPLAGILPNWIALLLRFEALTEKISIGKELLDSFQSQPAPDGRRYTVVGFFFINQALNVRSVADLAEVFAQLDSLSAQAREIFFADVEQMPNDFALIVNNAWLAEHRRGKIDWLGAAKKYLDMAKLASSWGYRDLALRCHIARGVMFDEYGDDGKAALKALDLAVAQLGPDPVLSRARAKIHYRQRDHANALALLKDSAASPTINDPVERTFMLREAAISAAELNQWGDAAQWFRAAREASDAAHSERMKAMAIGLQGDEATALYMAGDEESGIAGIADACEALMHLDPNESLRAAYCHRVLRHALLWMYGKVTGEDTSVSGQPAAMVAGMCSNPEPPEEIRDQPLASIDVGWYLVAQMEAVVYEPSTAEGALRKRLRGKSLPSMEIMVRKVLLDQTLQRLQVLGLRTSVASWLDALVYLHEHRDTLMSGDMINPAIGLVPNASVAQLRSDKIINVVRDLVLTFGVLAVLNERTDLLRILKSEIATTEVLAVGADLLDAIAFGSIPVAESPDNETATALHAVSEGGANSVEQLFVAGVRLVQFSAASNFGKILAPVIASWVKSAWSRAISEQRFALRAPSVTVPVIESAIASDGVGLQYAVKVLLAARSAVSTRISSDFANYLSRLA